MLLEKKNIYVIILLIFSIITSCSKYNKLLKSTDYEEKYKIEMVTVDTMESLESLNEDHISNQEKYNNKIKSMKYQHNVKYYHAKRESKTNSKRITLLETRNAKL